MAVADWLADFKTTDSDLKIESAVSLVRFVERYGASVASFVEARCDEARELVILDFRTGKPQRSACSLLAVERIAVLFPSADAMPFVFVLRDDFPDTLHQQLVPECYPKAICIDDRQWAEARLSWTPAELIQRTLAWFGRAARGELHDARQPIDPIFMGSPLNFIIARSLLDGEASEDLVAEHDTKLSNIVRVRPMSEVANPNASMEPYSIIGYRVKPEPMKRLQYAPSSFASLSAILHDRGINLREDLTKRFSTWLGAGKASAWKLNAQLVIIVEMPILSPDGQQLPGSDVRAFITSLSAGDVAVALGAAIKANSSESGSKVGYVAPLGNQPAADEDALTAIKIQYAEVHFEFDRVLATRLSGRVAADIRKAVIVGAGAIGSHVMDSLVREGRFTWTVIDDDRVLPHNLARHIVHRDMVARHKAETQTKYMNEVLAEPQIATSIPSNLLSSGAERTQIDEALNSADLIIDTTASVVAERFLSDHSAHARRISSFFNPAGTSVVVLGEPANRLAVLRDAEAQYLGLLVRNDALAGHLAKPPETVAYTGACRAITNVIPQSRISILSGLAAMGIGYAADSDAGTLAIWTLGEKGAVAHHSARVEETWRYKAAEWTIAIDAGLVERMRAMRRQKLPCETGGILFGLVDIPHKSIHLVEACPAPPDSVEERTGFVRGKEGVEEAIEQVRSRTDGQLRYVGEWHSHPPRASARPSSVDAIQIDWLAALMSMDSLPGLMVIAADQEISIIFANQTAEQTARPK